MDTPKNSIQDISNPIFAKNLQALFQQDEILATRLFAIDGNEKFDVFVGKDPIDINIIDKQTLKYIYEKPAKDIESMLQSLEKQYKRYPVMYFYGLGNGVLYKGLMANQTHQRIVVVEPELEIMYIVLNLIDFSQELASGRLMLFSSEFMSFTQAYFLISDDKFVQYMKLYDLHIHTEFYDSYSDDFERINRYFTRAFVQYAAACGNSIDDNLQGIEQNLINMPHMLTNYGYVDLIKKRKSKVKTAVIVSTGPSLTKQLPLLKKYAPYVSVISVDASYPILLKNGITPDYVTSIERAPNTSTFFEAKDKKMDKDIYFIIASVTHPNTVKNLKDRRMVITMRPGSDETSYKLNQHGYLGIGHSTANQAYQLAYVLNHKNIVLIGQDLAFGKDGASHAIGHSFTEDTSEYDIYATAYGGDGEIRTTEVWNLFRNQFEKDIDESSKEGFVTYNCTEGGARIAGAIEKPFSEVMSELCADKKVKKLANTEKVSDKVANESMLKAYKAIQEKINTQSEVKAKIEKVFLDITPKIDKLLKLNNEGKLTNDHFGALVKISDKIDKVKNMIDIKKYRKHVSNILKISVDFQERELAKISVAPSDTTEEKIKKLIEWLEMHKYWLFSAAGGLNADIEVTTRASKPLIKEMKKRGILPK
ncbi:motility associated factor glycosyltransferase family protein [Campylobacter mucosalis]|uniref:PseE protein, putative pseudaminic acid transferase n=1 Tax=Campylobacter mucosalis CCUG 21559 TaxID=1032067 RepID=A0A6G5QEM8_9BACT|nr:6-hydroxymethylpterin diphosphokinase MptE-like protein [Campylobacter mucosalis]QCD44017.1 PseE protein, putative pseudaminic acid transferase [Campylobacter mucosalis CCUG 21559]